MALPLLVLALLALPSDSSVPTVNVRLDEHRHELIVTAGPFRVEPAMAMAGMDMMNMHDREALVGQFAWPKTTGYYGVRLAVVDERGGPMLRRLLHHTYMVNFDRRQLAYPIAERPFSFGEETEDVSLPASVGMPMSRGQRMGIVIMWDNETGHVVDGAYVRYTFRLNPHRQWPAPVAVMPFFVDANMTAGGTDTFSVAPGGRVLTTDFTVAVSGHLLAASGHLHDHAVSLRLEDVSRGRTLVTVHAIRDSTGHVLRVSREILAKWTRGPRLVAGRRYRLVLEYDNPTPDTLSGVMGMMGGLFRPDHFKRWPALDPNDPVAHADLVGLLAGQRLADALIP